MHPIIAEALVRNYQSNRINYSSQAQRGRMPRSTRPADRPPRRRLRWGRRVQTASSATSS